MLGLGLHLAALDRAIFDDAQPPLPPGYLFLTDNDAAPLADDDGALVIEED